MANRHFYFSFENLALSAADFQEMVDRYAQRGQANQGRQPAFRNHTRERLDGQEVLFEALFNEAAVNTQAVTGSLASVTGVTPPNITVETAQTGEGTDVHTYSLTGVASMVQRVFAGEGVVWNDSRLEVLAYIVANQDQWAAVDFPDRPDV